MAQAYSDPSRENDPPAAEVAARDEDMVFEYMKRHEFRLASMNGKVREAMFDAMVEENGIEGGWFFWFCFPGCMPDSDPFGPYGSQREALAAAQDMGE